MPVKTNKINPLFGLKLHGFTPLVNSAHAMAEVLRKSLFNWLQTFERKLIPGNLALIAIMTIGAMTALYSMLFFVPRNLKLAYAPANCFFNPVFLPATIKKQSAENFALALDNKLSLAGYPIYSETTCVVPTAAPKGGEQYSLGLMPLGNSFFKKNLTVSVGNLPQVAAAFDTARPVSLKYPLNFNLDQADELFKYRLSANQHETVCVTQGTSLQCDLGELGLNQGTGYNFKLDRYFGGNHQGTVFNQTVSIVEPVAITSSSIAQGTTVYSAPQTIELTFNKPLTRLESVKLEQLTESGRDTITTAVTHKASSITVSFETKLAREKNFELTITGAESADGAYLPVPYVLSFTTSSGPTVQSISTGSIKVSPDATFVITFDAGLEPQQNFARFASIEVGGSQLNASVTGSGNKITVNPADPLPRCTRFHVKVAPGLVNEYGVGEGKAWQFDGKTICQTAFSIGSSVKGRALTAYRFGSGESKILFVGGLHGNEKSSVYILNKWVDYLEANAERIPAHRTIIVIPNMNPDGYARGLRRNANDIDLNRNFASNSWTPSNYGGSEPLSEPESRALANYVLSISPRLVLSYHATGGVVMPNEGSDSKSLASVYDKNSNVSYLPGGDSGEFFGYSATGTFEGWLVDRYNLPALLIELWTNSGQEFGGNQNAMWAMVELP